MDGRSFAAISPAVFFCIECMTSLRAEGNSLAINGFQLNVPMESGENGWCFLREIRNQNSDVGFDRRDWMLGGLSSSSSFAVESFARAGDYQPPAAGGNAVLCPAARKCSSTGLVAQAVSIAA